MFTQLIDPVMKLSRHIRARPVFLYGLMTSLSSALFISGCAQLERQARAPVAPVTMEIAGDDEPLTRIARVDAQVMDVAPEPDISSEPDTPTDLWVRLRDGFALPHTQNARIEPQLNWYRNNPRYLDRVFDRADPYLYYILEQLEERDMPSEIALLPVVESAFDPFAYSHGRAAGLWQFIPGTGKRFGLKQDWWYDGRRDVLASTDAALDYLEYLHKTFDGDWMLALAAYNSGEGTVLRALRRNRKAGKPTDFWALDLPNETRVYVPKLLALSILVNDPDAHGLVLQEIPNEARIAQVETGGQLDLAVAAQLAEIPLEDLYKLNPGFNRWATDPQGPHRLVLPTDKAERFAEALAELPPEQRLRWVRHEIQSGETLSEVARQYHTTVAVLQETNQLNGNRIRAGKHLLVPIATTDLADYSLSAGQRLARTQSRNRGGVKMSHVVQKGDTFWELARHYKVPLRSLAKWNNMAPGDPLRLGQKLVIWNRDANQQTVRSIHYKVRNGDSLARISSRFNVSVNDLCNWNGITRKKYLQPGQTLKLYVDVTRQAES